MRRMNPEGPVDYSNPEEVAAAQRREQMRIDAALKALNAETTPAETSAEPNPVLEAVQNALLKGGGAIKSGLGDFVSDRMDAFKEARETEKKFKEYIEDTPFDEFYKTVERRFGHDEEDMAVIEKALQEISDNNPYLVARRKEKELLQRLGATPAYIEELREKQNRPSLGERIGGFLSNIDLPEIRLPERKPDHGWNGVGEFVKKRHEN